MADINQQQVVDYIKGISVLELSNLVKALETELGVSAAAAMPMAMPMGGGAAGAAAAAAPEEEKTEFNVVLKEFGGNKITSSRSSARWPARPEGSQGRGRSAPKAIKESICKEEAEAIKTKLKEAGATVEIE